MGTGVKNYWVAQTETGWAVGTGDVEIAWFTTAKDAKLFKWIKEVNSLSETMFDRTIGAGVVDASLGSAK